MITRAQFILSLLAATSLAEERPKHVFFLVGDSEYKTGETVPAWARAELEPLGIRCTFIVDDPNLPFDVPQLSSLKDADALFISIKRRGLPQAQMDIIRQFAGSGKAIIGIRTASHALDPKKPGATDATWPTFDRDVFGGHYENHYGKGPATVAKIEPKAAAHQVLKGFPTEPVSFASHLYKCRELAASTTVLLNGGVEGKPEISEPLAWLNSTKSGSTFYTSLGSPEDFQVPAFRKLLLNSTLLLLSSSVEKK
jgi:type 1 glutamine amidotransferase